MIKRCWLAWVACLLLGGVTAQAGNALLIRLVRASNTPGIDPAVQDVVQAMGANFTFKGFSLKAQTTVTLPASGQVRLGDYTVACSGAQKQLSIRVTRGKQQMLETVVSLVDGKPIVVGGFPADDGHHLLVFTAR
jgi:hypothetical protein